CTSWCVLPVSPVISPAYAAPIFTFAWVWATSMRIGSMARWVKKTAKEESQGTKPSEAKPTATPTQFCSAIPICRNLSGYIFANLSALVELAKSASKTTTLGLVEPKETSVSPNTSCNAFILLPPQCQVPQRQF